MNQLGNCEICGKEIYKIAANLDDEGFNVNNEHSMNDQLFSSLKGEYLPNVFICYECANIYLRLLDLKIEWYLLSLINSIYCIPRGSLNKRRRSRCIYCKEWFTKKHGNQKYCPECSTKYRKEYKREHAREAYRVKKVYNKDLPICARCKKPIEEHIDPDKPFVHGNKKFHQECYFWYRLEYEEKWALNWFKENLYWLDPRRGVIKYNFYDSSGIRWHGGSRNPYEEYKYINSSLCYKCREVGVFKTIRKSKKITGDKIYIIRHKKCKNCGHESISKKERNKNSSIELYIHNTKRSRKQSL